MSFEGASVRNSWKGYTSSLFFERYIFPSVTSTKRPAESKLKLSAPASEVKTKPLPPGAVTALIKFAEGLVLLDVGSVKKILNCVGVGEAVVIVDVEVTITTEVALTVLIV